MALRTCIALLAVLVFNCPVTANAGVDTALHHICQSIGTAPLLVTAAHLGMLTPCAVACRSSSMTQMRVPMHDTGLQVILETI